MLMKIIILVENPGDYTIEYTISSLNESCGVDTAYFDFKYF